MIPNHSGPPARGLDRPFNVFEPHLPIWANLPFRQTSLHIHTLDSPRKLPISTPMSSQFMPFRRERTAPVFDRNHPTSLRRYFVQLETLFTRHGITDDLEKKTYVTSFLECDLADQWEALQQFSGATNTYTDFKAHLFDIYNLNVPRYTLFDLERLVSDRFRSGFPNLQALTEYHLQFNQISSHLLEFGLLSPREQSHLYLQAFDTFLQPRIDLRLQIKYPDHHPSRPYSIDTLFDAARWILRDPSAFPTPPILSPLVSSTTQTPTIPDVTLSDVAKAIVDVISNPSDLPPTTSLSCPSTSTLSPLASFLSSCSFFLFSQSFSRFSSHSFLPYFQSCLQFSRFPFDVG